VISTHILDTTKGQPAAGVTVVLEKKNKDHWMLIGSEETNPDGRIVFTCPHESGDFRLTFKIENYFKGQDSFFLDQQIAFHVKDTSRKYHVPLIVNPFGLSTYRGS
jgi:5-hydroxyisourate hydrolase